MGAADSKELWKTAGIPLIRRTRVLLERFATLQSTRSVCGDELRRFPGFVGLFGFFLM